MRVGATGSSSDWLFWSARPGDLGAPLQRLGTPNEDARPTGGWMPRYHTCVFCLFADGDQEGVVSRKLWYPFPSPWKID
jgi:hypothetical protein